MEVRGASCAVGAGSMTPGACGQRGVSRTSLATASPALACVLPEVKYPASPHRRREQSIERVMPDRQSGAASVRHYLPGGNAGGKKIYEVSLFQCSGYDTGRSVGGG